MNHPWYERFEDHHRLALAYLAGRDIAGWERLADAAHRFAGAFDAANAADVVAVSHGIVMAVWAGTVVGGLNPCFDTCAAGGQPGDAAAPAPSCDSIASSGPPAALVLTPE